MIGNVSVASLGIPNVIPPFNPNSISGLKYWYDANDGSTITSSGGRVSALANKATGITLTLLQATSGKQPLIVASAQGGKQVLQFTNARADQLYLATSPMSGATAHSTFLAYKSTSSTTGYKFAFGNDSGAGTSPLFYQLSSHNYYETSSGGSSTQGTNNIVNVANIMAITQSSGSSPILKTYTGGTAAETITGTAGSLTVGTAGAGSFLGQGLGGAAPTDFNFCEVLTYNNVLSAGDQAAVVAYLTAKWGI